MTELAAHPPAPLALTLITRSECGLCDDFQAALARWDAGRGLHTLTLVDADGSPDLQRRYGRRVPVLLLGDEEICATCFDAAALSRRLSRDESR